MEHCLGCHGARLKEGLALGEVENWEVVLRHREHSRGRAGLGVRREPEKKQPLCETALASRRTAPVSELAAPMLQQSSEGLGAPDPRPRLARGGLHPSFSCWVRQARRGPSEQLVAPGGREGRALQHPRRLDEVGSFSSPPTCLLNCCPPPSSRPRARRGCVRVAGAACVRRRAQTRSHALHSSISQYTVRAARRFCTAHSHYF